MDNSYRENEGLPFTKQQLAAVLSSSEGKQLLSLLSRDGGAALSQAAQAFKNGDTELAKSIVSPLMQSDEAQALIEKKAQAQEPIHVFGEIEVLNGRFGPYIKANGNNYKIPKGQDAQALTEEDCREIIANSAPSSGGKRAFSRKKAK